MAELASMALPAWPTESARVRALAPDAGPGRGPAAVLRLLGSARPADVPGALSALTADQLAEAVAGVELPVAPAVVDDVWRRGPASARSALARRLVERPEHVPPRPLSPQAYLRTLSEAAATDYRDGAVTRIRAVALQALSAGALSAEQLLERTRPAALTLTLAVCTPASYSRPWLRRATGDVRVLLARYLTGELGQDFDRWATAISLSGSFTGTLAELLRADEAPAGPRRFFDTDGTDHAPQNVLLALAPRAIAARYLAGLVEPPSAFGPRALAHQWDWMLASGPLSRPLVEHVVAYGTPAQQRRLLGNELCPDSALEQAPADHHRGILLRKIVPPRVRSRVFRSFQAEPREARLWARGMAGSRRDQLVDLAWSLTDAPNLLRHVIAAALPRTDPATLTCLYGALAEAAGPEPVWALELDRAGTLDHALPPVRASIATCTAEPLVEAARRTPRRHWIDALDEDLFGCQMLRAEAELDRVGHFPLEALVATHLDGHPARWREVVRRIAAGESEQIPLTSIIAEAAAHAGASALTS